MNVKHHDGKTRKGGLRQVRLLTLTWTVYTELVLRTFLGMKSCAVRRRYCEMSVGPETWSKKSIVRRVQCH